MGIFSLIWNWFVLVLIVAVLLLIPSVMGMAATHINYDILSYLPEDLESVIGERYLENDYKLASTAMVTIENMPARQVQDLKEEIKKIDGVGKVLWVDDLTDITVPKEMLPQDVQDIFYGKNDATLVMVTFEDTMSSETTMSAIKSMKKLLDKDCFIGGMAAVVEDTRELVDNEIVLYVTVAVALLMVILFLSLESTVVPLLFIASIGVAVLYNMGTNYFLGEISFITKALAAVLQLAVTTDFSIFLLHRYEEEKTHQPDHEQAMATAIQQTFSSITGSSLTTIAGFLAMCTMSLTLGTDIGVVMAKGVLFGVLCTVTVLPALIMLFDKPIERFRHRTFIPKMKRLSHFIVKRRVPILIVFLILVTPFVYGQANTNVYYNLLDTLPDDLISSQGNQKLKDTFDMTATDFILVDDSLTNAQMNEITDRLEELDGVAQVVSFEKYVGGVIPDNMLPQELSDTLRKAGKEIMMVNSLYPTASDEQNAQLDKMNAILKEYDKDAYITGEAPMTKDLIDVADRDFKSVNITSIALVFLIIALVFKSISVPFLLVLAIESAISINMGIPFFTGETIPFISSIVIGTIQLGATVDYAILMTNRFREERSLGHSAPEAAQLAIENCSQSIITSALAFFLATVGVGLIADVDLIKSLCLMMARGALISMFVILFILPTLLILFNKVIEKTSRRWLYQQPSGETAAADDVSSKEETVV
jgi:predicted RND superfamily exporter protein